MCRYTSLVVNECSRQRNGLLTPTGNAESWRMKRRGEERDSLVETELAASRGSNGRQFVLLVFGLDFCN